MKQFCRYPLSGIFAFALWLILLSPCGAQQSGEPPALQAYHTDHAPVIDGRLDDTCWRNAVPVAAFTQRQPRMGEPATFPIAVRVAYDSDHIYIGFEIHCGDPSKLISTVLQRDGAVNNYDDHFGFRLDTFHNHRDLYYFYINPKGTRLDGHASDEGVISDDNWDGVWEVKTRLLPDGWCGEVVLPLYNFRFRENEDGVWGFACLTYVSATQENVMWPFMEKNTRKPSLFGHITGLKGLNKERPLLLQPSVSQGSSFGRKARDISNPNQWNAVADKWDSNFGLDLRYRPASYLETNAAINPDFATVEADEFVFNLTMDEFQYPEKRPFFTEGQDRFATPIQLLYTRRIGLGEEEMLGGGKLHGQVGRWSFGAMDVLTGKSFGDPGDNFSALRLKRDILRSSTLGILAVSKDAFSNGFENQNAAIGVDFNYQIDKNTRLVTQLAGSSRPGSDGNGFAGYLNYQFSGKMFTAKDNLSLSLTAEDITPDFDIQDIGYIGQTRLDRRGFQENIGYDYWIKARGVNRVSVSQTGWYYQDHDGNRRVQDGWSGQFSIESRNLIKPGFLMEKSFVLLPSTGKSYDNSQHTFSMQFGPYPPFSGNPHQSLRGQLRQQYPLRGCGPAIQSNKPYDAHRERCPPRQPSARPTARLDSQHNGQRRDAPPLHPQPLLAAHRAGRLLSGNLSRQQLHPLGVPARQHVLYFVQGNPRRPHRGICHHGPADFGKGGVPGEAVKGRR